MSAAPDGARLLGLLERLVAIDTQNPPGREAESAARNIGAEDFDVGYRL